MRTISIVRHLALALGCSMVLPAAADASAVNLINFAVANAGTLSVLRVGSKIIVVDQNHKQTKVRLDGALQRHFAKSEEIEPALSSLYAQSMSNWYVVVTREPSTKRRGAGYCGAGFEDYVLLIEATPEELTLNDETVLQSCLKSIALASDYGDDPMKALHIDTQKNCIGYRVLGSDADKAICVVGNRFVEE